MTDRIHTPAQAIEAAAIEASRWLMVDAPAQTIGEAIRALADRIAPQSDVAGLVGRLWVVNGLIEQGKRIAPERCVAEAADALTALSGQVAALTEDINRHVAIASAEADRAEAAEARVAALTAELDAALAQVAGAREAALREAASKASKRWAIRREHADKIAGMDYPEAIIDAKTVGAKADEAEMISAEILALIPATPAPDVAQAALANTLAEEGERANVKRVEHCWPEKCWIVRWGPFGSEADASKALAALRAIGEGNHA